MNPSAPPAYGEKPMTGIPVPGQFQPNHPGTWSTGLCDCTSDCSNCCITCWCPCITFGQIAEIVDKGTTSCGASGALYFLIEVLTGCGCIYSCFYRTKMRKQYMLPESPCGDCCLHFCCEPCALCQEHRELKHRGYDMSIGCITCWCPCITFGQIAEIVDEGTTSCVASGGLYFLIGILTGCGCIYSCFYRSKMRKQYMLPESPCGDCLLHCCCESCALCQEYRELKHRGYDMSIGWQANMDKQNRGITMAPEVQGGMSR